MQPFAPIANVGPGIAPRSLTQFRAFPVASAPLTASVTGLHFGLVYPDLLSLQEWADALSLTMGFAIPQLHGEEDFERWAAQVADEPVLQPFQIPRPQGEWHAWAHRFLDSIAAAGAL